MDFHSLINDWKNGTKNGFVQYWSALSIFDSFVPYAIDNYWQIFGKIFPFIAAVVNSLLLVVVEKIFSMIDYPASLPLINIQTQGNILK